MSKLVACCTCLHQYIVLEHGHFPLGGPCLGTLSSRQLEDLGSRMWSFTAQDSRNLARASSSQDIGRTDKLLLHISVRLSNIYILDLSLPNLSETGLVMLSQSQTFAPRMLQYALTVLMASALPILMMFAFSLSSSSFLRYPLDLPLRPSVVMLVRGE